ncbi:Golgin subfamily A member 1 [Fukomys damarensis]|uniref:Golgin subfamily A member 1 n=1 Tax=Fukomys damarensis TaxID=885580 RepID=A0A091CL40_FUKDA|nr:Golgin subfamily A member 1 [Fukomys damarensis]
MFAKLKKKIAEETAVAQRPGGATRIPRSVSKESVASVGADSGDDFASDGSSSREDLSSQLLRRNEQIRKLEARLSDYAEQVRNLQKIKEKLEIALEKHQDSSMRKFQEQNEAFQANRAKMTEGLALALARKDQEKRFLTAQLQEIESQSLNLFQRRDEIDELEGFQQQELSKVKHMLLKKEDSLGKIQQELEAQTKEFSRTQEELITSNQMSSDLRQKLEELQRHYSALEEQRDYVTAAKADAENKITALEQKEQELQAFIQQLSIDLQKVTAETQEKEKLITHLQEKVVSLERRLEQNLSGEEYVQELLKEKTVAEQNLEDTRQQLLAARTSQAQAISVLETRVKELQQSLQASEERFRQSSDLVATQEAQIQQLVAAKESSLSEQQTLALKQQCMERTCALEAQIVALEQARVADQTAAEHAMSELEREHAALQESRNEYERSLQHHQVELKKLKEEWSQREIVSVAMAQALEEVRKQREEFQQQAAELTATINEKEQILREKAEVLLQKEQEILQLKKGHDSALLQMHQLQSELDTLRTRRVQEAALAEAREDLLRLQDPQPCVTVKAAQDPVYQLCLAEETPNGEVGPIDLGQLQKEKQDLEQQLTEKNKTIKQMQQRMLELRKTLQRELKIKPDSELFEVREKPGPEMPNMASSVTNNADLTDAREINFEYLKHVVLKFMSCRESEAFHLIKAVSVLLNFSQEEENMLKETLEYKMSWFGSKPAPKGSIRPSISNPRIPWS